MVVDLHCHIIPQIDDGSESMDESMQMLRMAASEGIGAIVATPHFEYGMKEELLEKRQKQFTDFCRYAKESGTSVEIYPGNEIFYSDSAIEALLDKTAWSLNGTRYVLVEFPVYAEFSHIQRAVRKLQYAGYWPVLAHIERYDGLKKIESVEQLVDQGTFMQVNASAVTGKSGYGVKQYIKKLMRYHLVHFLGTDAHGSVHRKPEMKSCLGYIKRKAGADYCYQISEENPGKLIRGEHING